MNYIPGKNLLGLALAAGCLAVGASYEARANSYASSLTNNLGEVSFRLNDAADSVKIVGNAGALTIDLGALPRGLTVTNLLTQGLLPGAFSVRVVQVGSGAPALIGGGIPFNSPRGVAVNSNPKSPNFGWVYVANSANGAKGDGLFAYSSDLSDILNQGATARTGGITNFTAGASASPYRLKVGRDDNNIYVADWSDASGNLYVVDPNLSDSPNTSYALKPGVKTRGENPDATNPGVAPVGPDNNHGSVAAVEALGSLADGNLQVFTIDEDYQSDPSSSGLNEINSLWRYDVGAGPLPYNDPPAARIGTAPISFVSQTMDLSYSPGSGYFYYSDMRSNGTEPGVIAVDPDGNVVFNSRLASQDLGSGVDYLIALQGVAASPDGKWLATLGNNNVVTIVPMADGIPNLAGRFQYTGFATTASGRGIAFDAANNLYVVSSGVGVLQALSLGFTATNTTSSDGAFSQTIPSTEVSGTLIVSDSPATDVTLAEANVAESAIFRITRAKDDLAGPLSVNIAAAGATRGTDTAGDFSIRTNGVVIPTSTAIVIPAGEASIDLQIVVNDDNISELAETLVLTVAGGAYNAVAPTSGTITIVDNDATSVDISAVSYNTAYEGNTNDFIRYTVQRRGDLAAAEFTVNIAYAGTATAGADYTAVTTVAIPSGSITNYFDVPVLNDTALEVAETVIASITTGSDYAVGTNNVLTAAATAAIIDDEEPAETVLFADNFNTDTSANWKLLFASVAPESLDYEATFASDYSALGVPAAPHSIDGSTLGLALTVNKGGITNAAGLNLYPKDKSFSGNFAVRFDMYLMQNNGSGTTEHATYGINHSGEKTNWFRNSGNGAPAGSEYDGLWYYVVSDASDLGANLAANDYGLVSSPTIIGLNAPTTLASRLSSQFTQAFHSPPWTSGGGAGSPGNISGSATPSWAQVEISQIGNIVQMRINSTVIMTYTNKTAYTNGNLMLGYLDAYDSVGSGGGMVIYDNVRVVKLPDNIAITNVVQLPGNKLQFDFNGFVNEPASAFKLVTSGTNILNNFVADANAQSTVSVVTPGTTYRVTTPTTNTAGFYEIRRP